MLNSYWFFSREAAGKVSPPPMLLLLGGDLREVDPCFRVLVERLDLRYLGPDLAFGVLTRLHLRPTAFTLDRLRPPGPINRPTTQNLSPLVRSSFGARRHRGPPANLDTYLQEPE